VRRRPNGLGYPPDDDGWSAAPGSPRVGYAHDAEKSGGRLRLGGNGLPVRGQTLTDDLARGIGRVVHVRTYDPHRGLQADAGLRQLGARHSAGDRFLVAARALGLGLLRQVAGLVPARRKLAHAYRAVLRMDAAATTHVLGYDLRKRIVRAAVVHRHGVWIMPLPLRYYTPSRMDAVPLASARPLPERAMPNFRKR
jgi:hypothetical protein